MKRIKFEYRDVYCFDGKFHKQEYEEAEWG